MLSFYKICFLTYEKDFLIRFFLIVLIIFSFHVSYGQKVLNEVELEYDITVSERKGLSAKTNFSSTHSFKIFIKGDYSRTELSSPLGIETNIYDNRSREGFIIKEYSDQKLIIPLNDTLWHKRNGVLSQIEFKLTDEEKVVSGFACKKALVINEESISDFYVSPEYILFNNNFYHAFSKINRIPVYYVVKKSNFTLEYSLKSLKTGPVSPKLFEVQKSLYRELKYEELMCNQSGG